MILLDHADNCGSGATQDVMTAIEAVMRAGLEDVVVGAVWDPEAVAKMREAGVGAEVEIDLGGPHRHAEHRREGPAAARLRHRPGSSPTGAGRCAVRCTRGCGSTWVRARCSTPAAMQIVVVVSHHHEPWDLGVFTSMGIQPQHHRYILLKSRIHYRAGFGDLPKLTPHPERQRSDHLGQRRAALRAGAPAHLSAGSNQQALDWDGRRLIRMPGSMGMGRSVSSL